MFIFLNNFLKNRTIQVKAHNEFSATYQIENGVPQGSVISVTMFLTAINDIFNNIPNDCYIYCSGNNIRTTTEILQISLNSLQNWSKETDFIFSPTKSQCIIFNHKDEINQQIKLKNLQTPICHNLRILGLIFDNKLKWNTHLKKLKSSCKIKINIKTLVHYTWGADQNLLLNIYMSP